MPRAILQKPRPHFLLYEMRFINLLRRIFFSLSDRATLDVERLGDASVGVFLTKPIIDLREVGLLDRFWDGQLEEGRSGENLSTGDGGSYSY